MTSLYLRKKGKRNAATGSKKWEDGGPKTEAVFLVTATAEELFVVLKGST